MARVLYQALLILALPWVRARLLLRARAEPAYRQHIGQRFGHLPAHLPQRPIWFHAVSAGETNAAAPVIRAVRARLPGARLLVTTMTPAGKARAEAALGDIAAHCYAPYDYPWAVARFLKRIRPRALVLMETELWPNLIRQSAAAGVPVYLANARLSERSYRGYRRIGGLVRPMLRRISGIACQYEDTAARLRALGAARAQAIGSVKFDAAPAEDAFGVGALGLGDRPTWIAGSTHAGEEEMLLDAHRALLENHPRLRLILVPRHPARVPSVAAAIAARGLAFGLLSRRETAGDVLLGDVMGALPHLYAHAAVAFVGGSLDATGGHNPIEAAARGLPMLMGPARFQIEEIAARFAAANCLHLVRDSAQIARAVAGLLSDESERAAQGRRARAVVDANRGATAALADLLCGWLADREGRERPQPASPPARGSASRCRG